MLGKQRRIEYCVAFTFTAWFLLLSERATSFENIHLSTLLSTASNTVQAASNSSVRITGKELASQISRPLNSEGYANGFLYRLCGEWVGDGGEAAVVSQGLKEICFGTPIFCCFLFKNIFFYLEIIFDDRSETEIAQRVSSCGPYTKLSLT